MALWEFIAFLIRLADAADMPATRAASLTPRPLVSSRRTFSTLVTAIGGRPNFTFAPRAAA